MSVVRTLLYPFILTALVALIPTSQLLAQPTIAASFGSATQGADNVIHLTLRTQEGLERFVFFPQQLNEDTSQEDHYAGFARPRNFQKSELPAALTISDRRAWVFFTSRRTGRPVAATISLNRTDTSLHSKRLRVSRVPKREIACGTLAGHDDQAPFTASAAHKRRTQISSESPIVAHGLQSFSPTRILEIATDADFDFYQVHGEQTNSYIRAVINAADVIYTSTLGIRLKVTTQRVAKVNSGARGMIPAVDLLTQFRNSPYATSSSADIRHLFTGRAIDGLTIGIAYVGTVCTAGGAWSVGLSSAVSAGLQPFLAAHEIAHNLSATHDQEPRSIMNPAITQENNRFTERATSTIYDFVSSTGSCLSTEELSGTRVILDTSDPTLFSASVKFTTRSSSCGVTLYGSADGRRYIPIASATKRAPSVGAPSQVEFQARAPQLVSPQTFHFKARVSCGGSKTTSPAAKLRYGFATSDTSSNSRSSSRWLISLKRNLNS